MKTPSPDAWSLGGTLFVPLTHQNLASVLQGEKFPLLRSVVIDMEDGIEASSLEAGLTILKELLPRLSDSPLHRFIRPRNPEILEIVLQMDGIENMDGFILPKFGIGNMHIYLSALERSPFLFMPSIEGIELFEADSLRAIRNSILPFLPRIPVVRFGAEDMLRQLGLRRECSLSLFDMALPSQVIGNMMGVFKPYGFEISGGVYRCFQNHEGFTQDLLRDLREGLIGKTIIHPNQILWIEQCYKVSAEEYEEAKKLFDSKEAVFALNGTMAETQTQKRWAVNILRRYELYGIKV